MSESNATKTLRLHLVKKGAHVQRIEDKLQSGIPDTNITWAGVDAWLEGKFLKDLPARDDTPVRFGSAGEPRLAHQRNWLTARYVAGGLVFWWVRVQTGGWYLFDDRFDWLRDGVPKKVFLQESSFRNCIEMVGEITRRMSARKHLIYANRLSHDAQEEET